MSSYARMDHAAWVTRQIEATRREARRALPRRTRKGKLIGWDGAPAELTPFQVATMNILGIVGGGIYNAPISWDSLDWSCGPGLLVTWRGSLASYDFDGLTRLVMLCHDARIRVEVEAAANGYLRLFFAPRDVGRDVMRSHPSLEEAVARHRAEIPADHPLCRRAALAAAEAGE